MSGALTYSINDKGIATLIVDLPNEKVNTLSLPILEELEEMLNHLSKQAEIKALVIKSGKEGVFIAGADLKSFEPLFKDAKAAENLIGMGHRVFSHLSQLPFPTIAAIDGSCLGGGLELALACTYRVVSDHPKTYLGLPEVSLGIIPGWGGTQRLPRLIGLVEGLKMIVTGVPVKATQAWKIKLADAIFPSIFFQENLNHFVESILTEKGKDTILEHRKRHGVKNWILEKNPLGRAFVYWMTKKEIQKKTKGHYTAPFIALKLVKNTYSLPLKEGLRKEAEVFVQSMNKDFRQAPHLIQLFFNQEAIKKNPGFKVSNEIRPIQTAAVIGAGIMGSGIAWLFSHAGIPVRMKDLNWEAVSKGYASAWDIYRTLIKKKKLKPNEANMQFLRITGTVDYTGFKQVDLVVEAAAENLEIKQQIFKELEDVVRPDTILATNTSSLTLESLSRGMRYPERLVGMHFFNPPNRMPLVEVVASKQTAPFVVATTVELCKLLKKTPIVVGDCSGFLVNRIFANGEVEIFSMLEEGVEFNKLEKAILDFGIPMGPFQLADEVGNDINYKVLKSFEQVYGPRMKVPAILAALNARKLYGKKVGKGFYLYDKKQPRINPEIAKLIPQKKNSHEISNREIIERVMLAMILEASRALEEKVTASPMHVDMAMVLGTGFPPFRGGLLRYADSIGTQKIVERLEYLKEKYGDRFQPSPLLVELAKNNRGFY